MTFDAGRKPNIPESFHMFNPEDKFQIQTPRLGVKFGIQKPNLKMWNAIASRLFQLSQPCQDVVHMRTPILRVFIWKYIALNPVVSPPKLNMHSRTAVTTLHLNPTCLKHVLRNSKDITLVCFLCPIPGRASPKSDT